MMMAMSASGVYGWAPIVVDTEGLDDVATRAAGVKIITPCHYWGIVADGSQDQVFMFFKVSVSSKKEDRSMKQNISLLGLEMEKQDTDQTRW